MFFEDKNQLIQFFEQNNNSIKGKLTLGSYIRRTTFVDKKIDDMISKHERKQKEIERRA